MAIEEYFDEYQLGAAPEAQAARHSVQELKEAAIQYADHYGVPRDLMLGYFGHESNWRPTAKNPGSSARGLGQIIDATGERLGLRITGGPDDERFDPAKNMDAIGREMARLYEIQGDWKKVLLSIGEPHEGYYNLVKNRAKQEMGLALGERLPALSERQDSLLEVVKNYLGYQDLPKFLPIFNRDSGQWEKQDIYQARKLFHGWEEDTELERVLSKGLMALGPFGVVTKGVFDYMRQDITGAPMPEPESYLGAVAGGFLSLGGFIASPYKIAQGIIGGRLVPTRSSLRNLAQLMAEGGATLGLATGISHLVPRLMQDDNLTEAGLNLAKDAGMNMLLGAIFPLIGVGWPPPKEVKKAIPWALKLAAGFAAVDFIQAGKGNWSTVDDVYRGIRDGKITAQELGHKTVDYLLNLYFIAKTPTMKKSVESLKVNALMAEAARVNPQEAEDAIIEIGKSGVLQEAPSPRPSPPRGEGERAFVPSTEWQVAPKGMELPPGAEVGRNMATGETLVRWPRGVEGKEEHRPEAGATLKEKEEAARDREMELEEAGKLPPTDAELGLVPSTQPSPTRGEGEIRSTGQRPVPLEEQWEKPWNLGKEEYLARDRALTEAVEGKVKTEAQVLKEREREVERALKRGEEVKPEVLAEFSGLAKKYGKEAPSPQPSPTRGEGEAGELPPVKAKRAYDLKKALEHWDLRSIILAYGGFNSRARIIKENFTPEEQRQIRLLSRKGAQGPDALLAELKQNHPDHFNQFETDVDLLRAIVDGSFKKILNREAILSDLEAYDEYIAREAERGRYSAEDIAADDGIAKEKVAAEILAETGQRGPGEPWPEGLTLDNFWDFPFPEAAKEEPLALASGKPKTSALEARLEQLTAEYPSLDRESAATVLRALPEADNNQVAALASDPEMFSQVARGNLSAQERTQLYQKATDLGQQMALEGLGGGDLFGKKMYGGGPETAELVEYGKKVVELGGRLVDWFDARLERNLPPELRDPDVGKVVGSLLLKFQQFEDIGRTYPEARPFFEAAREGVGEKSRFCGNAYSLLVHYTNNLTPAERAKVDKVMNFMDTGNSPAYGREFRLGFDIDIWRAYLENPQKREEVREKGIAFYMRGVWDPVNRQGLSRNEAEGAFAMRMALDYARADIMDRYTGVFQQWLDGHGFNRGQIKDIIDRLLHTESPPADIAKIYFGAEPGKFVVQALSRFRDDMQYWLKETNQYVPHMRYGDYFIRVFDTQGKAPNFPDKAVEPGALVYAAAAETKAQYHEKIAAIREQFPESEGYVIKQDLERNLPIELYVESQIPKVTRLIQEGFKSRGIALETRAAALEGWQDFLAAKGFGAHYHRRLGTPGYETDLLRPVTDYLAGMGGYVGKMKKIEKFAEAYTQIPKEMPNLFRHMNEYTNYVLSNPYEYEGIRNLIFHWTLSMNLSFHTINATQNLTVGWGVLGQVSRKPMREMGRAMWDWGKWLAIGEGLRPGEEAILQKARLEPELAPSMVGELSGRAYNPLYRWLHNDPTSLASKGIDVLKEMISGSFVEKMNRETFFLSAFRATGDFNQAIDLTRQAHFLYGKETRPELARGAGSLPFIFMTYSVNYFTLLKNFSKAALGISPEVYGSREQGAKGLARMMAGAMVAGGLVGTPVFFLGTILKAAWQEVFGSDLEEDGKKYLQEDLGMGEAGGEFASRLLWRGLPAAALGMDLSNRIAPNLPFTNVPGDKLTWQGLVGAGLGAASIPMQKGFMAATALAYGEPGRAVEYAAPTALQNLMAARRLGMEGATTLSGRPIFTAEGEPLKLTPWETAKKAVGFQPVRLAEHYRTERHAREMERERRDQAQDFAGRLARAIREEDEKGFDRAIDDWTAYNNRMLEKGRLADIISPESVERAVMNRFQPKYPDVSEKKMLLRQAGGRLEDIAAGE